MPWQEYVTAASKIIEAMARSVRPEQICRSQLDPLHARLVMHATNPELSQPIYCDKQLASTRYSVFTSDQPLGNKKLKIRGVILLVSLKARSR